MLAKPNPFYVGGPVPPDQFVGRKREVDAAIDQIVKRSHLAVYGSPGMGKSSILRYLSTTKAWVDRGRDPSPAVFVYLNCTDVNPFTPSGFWREVLTLLKDKFDDAAALQSQIDDILKEETVERSDLRRTLRKIGQKNRFLVLLLDDYDHALRPHEKYTEAEMLMFLSEFRNLAVHSDEGRYLSIVVTSLRRLDELGPTLTPSGSPWYNHYKYCPLKPFDDADVTALMTLMPAPWVLTLEQREGIREIADGHPALLQNACSLLYETLQAGKNPATDVKQFQDDFVRATQQFFRDAWTYSADVEQMLLTLIALSRLEGRLNRKRQYDLGDLDLIFSQRDRELIVLAERGVIRRTAQQEQSVYDFASSILEWWVVKEIENSQEAELERREKIFFNLLSRDQGERIKKVLRQVWQHKDAAVSVAGWVGKLIGAFVKGVAGGGNP